MTRINRVPTVPDIPALALVEIVDPVPPVSASAFTGGGIGGKRPFGGPSLSAQITPTKSERKGCSVRELEADENPPKARFDPLGSGHCPGG